MFLFLTILILVPIVAVCVSASSTYVPNTSNTNITNFDVPYYSYSKLVDPRRKMDTSPLYLYLENLGYSNYNILVQAIGCISETDKTSTVNLTVYNGSLVPYVACRESVHYAVRSDICEESYEYASLRFQDRGEASGNLIASGYWSPDSLGSYTTAPYPG